MTSLRLSVWLLIGIILSCNFIQLRPPPRYVDPTPTPTPPRVTLKRNPNAEALMAAKRAMSEPPFGFAPLLRLHETRLTVTSSNEIYLTYPRQPNDPNQWVAVDSFALAYGLQQHLLTNQAVIQASIGYFALAASIYGNQTQTTHFALWVSFRDGSGTVLDLTPLAADYGANHPATRQVLSLEAAHKQFAQWQHQVSLRELQPMAAVQLTTGWYYLLGQATATDQHITLSLQAHPVQVANLNTPLQLLPGSRIDLRLNRTDLKQIQTLFQQEGAEVLANKRHLWQRQGDDSPDLTQVLEQNLSLLWHMTIKLQVEP